MIVTQSVAKSLDSIHVDVFVDEHADASEILPPFGRLDDKKEVQKEKLSETPCYSVVKNKNSHKPSTN